MGFVSVAIPNMPISKAHLLGAVLMCAALLPACSDAPVPDFRGQIPVSFGNQTVSLSLEAWRNDGRRPCSVLIRGPEVTNWVKASGVLPRMTLGPAVVLACTGHSPYLSSVSAGAENEAAEWQETSGPDSAAPLRVYQVRVSSLTSDQARLELRAVHIK